MKRPIRKVLRKLTPPGKRADCESIVRPCPFVFCRYNLFSSIRASGLLEIKGHLSEYSCVLDVVEENGCVSLPEIGRLMNITMERVRQIESQALTKLQEIWDRDAMPHEIAYEYEDKYTWHKQGYGRAS